MAFHLNLIAEYNSVFPELDENIPDLVIGIPKDLIIRAATTFLGIDIFKKDAIDWRKAVRDWFRQTNTPFANVVAQRIINKYESIGLSPSIYSPVSNLKLLQLGLNKADTDESLQKTDEQIEIDLFKIYLKLNQITSERYLPSRDYISNNYPNDQPPLLLLATGFSISDLINYTYSREFYCQSVKALLLFCFLITNEKTKYVTAKFLDYYGIQNLKEYFGGLIPLMKAISEKEKDGFFEFNIIRNENYERNHGFISKLAVQHYNVDDDIDYKEIRAHPFVQVDMDKYRITHPIFFSDKIYKGIFFDLSKLNSEAPEAHRLKNFRSYYGSEFSEKYLFYEVMRYSFEKNDIQFSGKEIEDMNIDGGVDYYMRSSNDILLFENKDVLINAAIKENGTFNELEKEFKKKFLTEGKSPKAIKQLLNNITLIINQENVFDKDYEVEKLKIYPIIVVQDIMFEAAGFNFLLNLWFSEEINDLKKSKKPFPIIKPLVVLNIDTMIQISDALKNNKITMKEILNDYYKKIKFNPTGKFKDEEDFKNKIAETYMPASVHIENWLKIILPKSYPSKGFFHFAFRKLEEISTN